MKKQFKDFFSHVLKRGELTGDYRGEFILEIPDSDIREFLICVHAYNEHEPHKMCVGIGKTDANGLTLIKAFVDIEIG